jgi:hypothetical protein
MDHEERRKFAESLPLLSKPEYENIFRILKTEGAEFTENSNGIFFNIWDLNENCFNKLNDYMRYCMLVRQEDDARNKEIESLKKDHKG